jgi:hypothetical protein
MNKCKTKITIHRNGGIHIEVILPSVSIKHISAIKVKIKWCGNKLIIENKNILDRFSIPVTVHNNVRA